MLRESCYDKTECLCIERDQGWPVVNKSASVSIPVVAALVGRRIDAPTEPERFPLTRTTSVRQALGNLLRNEAIDVLVCSAACGADLIALDLAIASGVRCRIVLPYSATRFRESSVIDRPGDWGPLYDRIIAAVDAVGDLLVLNESADDTAAFFHVNETIIREARALAEPNQPLAIIVWDGIAHGDDDATAQFHKLATDAGFIERTVSTC